MAIDSSTAKIQAYSDPHNQRIRIDYFTGEIIDVLQLIEDQKCDWSTKIIVKTEATHLPSFIREGYECEGHIPSYFSGRDMYFMCKYSDAQRSINTHYNEEERIRSNIYKSNRKVFNQNVEIDIREIHQSSAHELAAFYKSIFEIYPTPIFEADHIAKTLETGTRYLAVYQAGKIISAASAEINRQFMNAELTDCASASGHEGNGLMLQLLQRLEQILLEDGIKCHYTLARSLSFGMNKAFFNLGFDYGGRLTNNCQIFTGMENMNVWYKVHN